MIKRLKTGTGVAAGLAALALGGSAIAGAANKGATVKPASSTVSSEKVSGPDRDNVNVQSGDQTTPDKTQGSEKVSGPDRDNVKSGDQTTPDKVQGENQSESTGESSSASDGPGGYADAPGNANNQQQGEH